MVTLRGIPVDGFGAGEGLGSSFGSGQLDNQTREFISSEITCSILVQTPVIFGMAVLVRVRVLAQVLEPGCLMSRRGSSTRLRLHVVFLMSG